MGNSSSSFSASHGSLAGAYTPCLVGDTIPDTPSPQESFVIPVPPGKTGGDTIHVVLRGRQQRIKIPYRSITRNETGQRVFVHTEPAEIDRVYATTLPLLPGMEVVQSKPIIWGSVSDALPVQKNMGPAIAILMQKAQAQILEQAIAIECNAVLGMSFNITNEGCWVIVTASGTPCNVVPSKNRPAVEVDVIVEPLHNGVVVLDPASTVTTTTTSSSSSSRSSSSTMIENDVEFDS